MPTFNAEKTLEKMVKEIPKKLLKSVLLVNDGSKDKTTKIAKELGLKIINNKKNRGYGGAQKTGYKKALKLGADYVIMLHPDGQYHACDLPLFIESLKKGKGDLILGSRFLKDGYKQTPAYKQVSIKFITYIFNLILGIKITEANTGYRGYTRKLLKTIPFEKNISRGYSFDPQVIIQTVHYGFKIAEVPVSKSYNKEATSPDFIKSLHHGIENITLLGTYLLHKLRIKDAEYLNL